MLAITGQDPAQVEKSVEKWKLVNTTVKADPENTMIQYLEQTYGIRFVMGEKKGYPNGMVQPAELVFYKGTLIVGWIRKPSAMNFDGAMGRPDPSKMWKYIEKTVANFAGGENDPTGHVEVSDGRQFFSLRSSLM